MTASGDARTAPTAQPETDRAFGLIDVMESLARHRRRIAGATLAVAVLSAVVSLVLPSWFRSTATILGQEEATENRRIMMTVKALALPGTRQNLPSQSPETFLEILESRTLRERIIRRFDLLRQMKVKGMDAALGEFRRRVTVDMHDTGAISVRVLDRDRAQAAEIANAMVAELDSMNVELRIYRARRARQYLERQLAETRTWLVSVEDTLASFQSQNLVVSVDEQAKAAIEAVAALEARAMELKIQRGVLEGYASESNPELRAVSRELSEVESQLRRVEHGGGDGSFSGLPRLGVRYARLLRDVKVGETLLAFLTQEFEDARLEEAKDTPVVQVLDRAVPSDLRAKPKRKNIVVSATLVTFIVALSVAVAADRYGAHASDTDRRRWRQVWRILRQWKEPGGGAR